MKGVIFQELKDLVRSKLGDQAWADLLSEAKVETTLYSPMGTYPNAELVQLVTAFSRRTGLTPFAVLEELGKFLVVRFYKSRSHLFDPKWTFLDVVEHLGDIVNQVVDLQPFPDEEHKQAAFKYTRNSPKRVTMLYSSPRKYCYLWKGCIQGLAEYLGVNIRITEPFCMHQGNDHCEIIVDVIGHVPIGPKR